jgi:hypothetical protein
VLAEIKRLNHFLRRYIFQKKTCLTVVIWDYEIYVHPLHGEKEMEKNIESCNVLLKHDPEAKLKLLPVLDVNINTELADIATRERFYPKSYLEKFPLKNADCMYGKKVVEFDVWGMNPFSARVANPRQCVSPFAGALRHVSRLNHQIAHYSV